MLSVLHPSLLEPLLSFILDTYTMPLYGSEAHLMAVKLDRFLFGIRPVDDLVDERNA